MRNHTRPAVERLDPRTLMAASVPTPDHVVVVVEENHSPASIVGSSAAPYINSLIARGAYFSDAHAITHPSQPNYLDLFSGSNQGVTTDATPTGLPFTTPNLGSELIAAGRTFGGYSESEPSVGFTANRYPYARRHNPWVNWQGTGPNGIPAADNMPFSKFPADYAALPTVAFVVPNVYHDMHDGTIKQADTWLKGHLDAYVTWAQDHNSLLIVTWDEGHASPTDQVPLLFVGPMVQPGAYSEHIDHFGVLRSIEDMYGLPYAGASATAPPLTDVWTVPIAVPTPTPEEPAARRHQ